MRIRYALTIILLLIPLLSHASQDHIWVETEGEAYMGEIETQKETKERAKRNAEAKAIEQAVGTFIRSHTIVSNSQLAEDLVYASVKGKAEEVEILKGWWDDKDRNLYRVRLKALIRPFYPEKGDGITMKLSLSKTDLKEGDEVRIFYQADRACYVYLFSIAADGSVTLLFPNSVDRDNLVKPEKAYEFPSPGNPIKLKAMFLPGYKDNTAIETIKVIATKKKEEIVPLGFQEAMFKVYDTRSTGMISDLVKRLGQLEPSEWAEAAAVYKIARPEGLRGDTPPSP